MTDKIEEIRNRHLHDERWRNGPSMLCPQAHDDRATLLAEVERLREDIERLTGKLKLVADALNDTISKYHEVGDQVDRLDAENGRLRAENERLRDVSCGGAS